MTTHTRKKYTPTTTRFGRIPTGKSPDGRLVRSSDETVLFWIEGIYELESRPTYVNPTSIIAHGDSIYSYGTHFPMARMIRNERGRVTNVMVNADTWSGGGWTSTSQHQGQVRGAVNAHAKDRGIPVLEIPFSVLDAAGIRLEDVRVIENRESRYTTHEITSKDRPGNLAYVLDDQGEPHYIGIPNEGDDRVRHPNISTVSHEKSGMAHASAVGHAEYREGLWRWTVQRHWMGDSLIRAKSSERRIRKLTDDESARVEWYSKITAEHAKMEDDYRKSYVSGEGYDERLHHRACDLRDYKYELQSQLPNGLRYRGHARANEPVVEFTVQRWATYLSSFDYGEPHRPYFFCELPYGCKAKTVDEGVDALMPMTVRMAISLGDDVKRQGDVFAIPTGYDEDNLLPLAESVAVERSRYVPNAPEIGGETYVTTKVDVKLRRHKANEIYPTGALNILGTNHRCTHVIKTKDGRWFGRGRMTHSPQFRDPDHRVVPLEDGVWYEFVKNTVPEAKTNAFVGAAIGSGHSRAWSLGGDAD